MVTSILRLHITYFILFWFQGPYIEHTRTSLQKVVGDDNVLVVNFSDISGHTNAGDNFETGCHFYHHVFEDGIILGLRRYHFLSKFQCLGMKVKFFY